MSTNESSLGVETWSLYVAAVGKDIRSLMHAVAKIDRANATDAARAAFRIGLSSLLVGAEELGRLALAIERAVALVASGSLEPGRAGAILVAPAEALGAALVQLENPDKSGARIEGVPLVELAASLAAAIDHGAPIPASGRPPAVPPTSRVASASEPATSTTAFHWTPAVDDDMVELFFDEAAERIEGISQKLIELERKQNDPELLRDLFRDLHTVKGSSAMVGLQPVNRLAHAAEDLVGQLREGQRTTDEPAVNALLATLDSLRAMLDLARAKKPITTDPSAIVRALRDPSGASLGASGPKSAALAAPVSLAPETKPAEKDAPHATAARPTIRVDFDKLDRLLNLVGELVLGRDGLRTAHAALASVATELSTDRALARRASIGRAQNGRASFGELTEELGRVERVLTSIVTDLDGSTGNLDSVSSELRDQVMRLRMVPIGGVFRKHQRTVRDLAQSLGKRARLALVGEDTELDKLLVEALDEPLMHLVRNAVDHGIEGPVDREAAGKSTEATVRLEAFHRGNQVVIRIGDDGRGMDPERLKAKAVDKRLITEAEALALDDRGAFELIFKPGFSTAATVSDVSGRGVGMDVVRQTIVTRLKGTIDIESKLGEGSTFVLRLPLTLAIIQSLLARVAGETFAIPLDAVDRTLVISPSDVALVGDRETFVVDGETLPLLRLAHVLELDADDTDPNEALHVIVTEQAGGRYGLVCDRLLGKKEIVIKSLGELLSAVPCIAGATLLGDRCAIILDVPAVVARALRRGAQAPRAKPREKLAVKGTVLLVEDSDTVRESLRRLLVEAGYDVTTAPDGRAGFELAKSRRFDIVSTDVMMPHMDGYELTRALRAMPTYKDVPIVMVTSRGERIDRVRGFDAGVDDYITKPHDRQLLLRSIQRLLGHPHKEA